jgi:hypothetical protein
MKHSNEEQKQRGEPAGSLPLVGYVRLPTILRVFPVGKSTWWAGVQQERTRPLPRPGSGKKLARMRFRTRNLPQLALLSSY